MAESINISCPGCNTAFEVPDDMIGQTVECPQCNTQFEITAPGQDIAAASEEAAEEAAPEAIVYAICPGCQTVFEVTPDMLGMEVDCPQCTKHFTITEAPPPKAAAASETPKSADETHDEVIPPSEEESGAYTHTVRMSRTSIGMVPVVEDNFGLDVVGQHIQKTGVRKAFESGEYALKKETTASIKTQEPVPPPAAKKWWEFLLFWKK